MCCCQQVEFRALAVVLAAALIGAVVSPQVAFTVGMVGVTYAAVPLYRMFCQVICGCH